MALENIRVLLAVCFTTAYIVGMIFTLKRSDMKSFSLGFWATALALIILVPVILGQII